MNEDRLNFSLLANALDYLDSAADHALEKSARDWKYALLHVAAGIELLLKACLRQEHWSLLFANVDKASERAFLEGDFISVNLDTSIDRLKSISGVVLADETFQKLDRLRRYRNRVQHFAIDIAQEQVVSLVAFACHFSLDFIHEHISDGLDEVKDSLAGLVEKLGDFDEFVDVRMNAKRKEIDASYYVLECPECLRHALTLGDGAPKCLFCNYSEGADEVVWRFAPLTDPKDESPVEECPECGGPCLDMTDEAGWVCFACGEHDDYHHCSRCGALMSGDDLTCNDCWQYIVSRD